MSQPSENPPAKCEVHIVADNMPALIQALLRTLNEAHEYSLDKAGVRMRRAIGEAQVQTQFGAYCVVAEMPKAITKAGTYY
jgi:hypothetical protein